MMHLVVELSAGVGIGIAALALTTGLGYLALRVVVGSMARHLKTPQ